VSGCRGLFNRDDHVEQEAAVTEKFLKPLPTIRDGIRLDVFNVDRHVGDPRIGPSMWQAVSQGGSMEPAALAKLNAYGFRFGTVPANPPLSVQSLILNTESNTAERTSHGSFECPTGQHSILDVMQLPEGIEVSIPTAEGPRTLKLHQAKSVLRLRADRIESAWARLEVVPEIHHGERLNRAVPGEREWVMSASQEVVPLYPLRFHVELSRGEMAVIGLNPQSQSTIGRIFFRNTFSDPMERVMMIRLADVFTLQGISGA
jgi:hypothetical protein